MAGWGFSVNGEVDLQKYLNFLPLPTLDSEKCNATSHYAGFITKDNICAGFTDTNKGPCYVRSSNHINKKRIKYSLGL